MKELPERMVIITSAIILSNVDAFFSFLSMNLPMQWVTWFGVKNLIINNLCSTHNAISWQMHARFSDRGDSQRIKARFHATIMLACIIVSKFLHIFYWYIYLQWKLFSFLILFSTFWRWDMRNSNLNLWSLTRGARHVCLRKIEAIRRLKALFKLTCSPSVFLNVRVQRHAVQFFSIWSLWGILDAYCCAQSVNLNAEENHHITPTRDGSPLWTKSIPLIEIITEE